MSLFAHRVKGTTLPRTENDSKSLVVHRKLSMLQICDILGSGVLGQALGSCYAIVTLKTFTSRFKLIYEIRFERLLCFET
jgi:hypothetical protein